MIIASIATIFCGNAAAQKLAAQDVTITAGETADLVISFNATTVASSAQLYVTLPSGIEVAQNEEGDFDVTKGELPFRAKDIDATMDGSALRVLIYNTNKDVFRAASGTLVTIKLKAASDLTAGDLTGTINKIKFADSNAQSLGDIDDVNFKITVSPATGINGISADQLKNGEVYDLNGQKVSTVKKGVYIVNGKKTIVK